VQHRKIASVMDPDLRNRARRRTVRAERQE